MGFKFNRIQEEAAYSLAKINEEGIKLGTKYDELMLGNTTTREIIFQKYASATSSTLNPVRIFLLNKKIKLGIKKATFNCGASKNGTNFILYLFEKTSSTTYVKHSEYTTLVSNGVAIFENIITNKELYIAICGECYYGSNVTQYNAQHYTQVLPIVNNTLTVSSFLSTQIFNCSIIEYAAMLNTSEFELAYILNKELVSNNDHPSSDVVAKYTFADLGGNCSKIRANVKFIGDANITCVSTKNGMHYISDITSGSIHISFLPTVTYVGFYNRPTFDPQQIVDTYTYPNVLDRTGGTEYTVGFDVSGNDLTVYFPDGTTRSYTNENFGIVNGRYVCWEHYYNVLNGKPFITSISGESDGFSILTDDFGREDGSVGIAPTGHLYSQFRNV